MGKTEKAIIEVLRQATTPMKQSQIAQEVNKGYRDVYFSLKNLVQKGFVIKEAINPATLYALATGMETEELFVEEKKKEKKHNGLLPINDTIINETQLKPAYIAENKLITECFKKYPYNTEKEIIAMKIGLIDITNSTNLSRLKKYIDIGELADNILKVNNIDERIKNGDPTVVNEIANANKKVNLFSFASKYCCYHNYNLYGKDDYSIYDNILKKSLPLYFDDITERKIESWRKTIDYKAYNDYIGEKLEEKGIKSGRRKFDHFVWNSNR